MNAPKAPKAPVKAVAAKKAKPPKAPISSGPRKQLSSYFDKPKAKPTKPLAPKAPKKEPIKPPESVVLKVDAPNAPPPPPMRAPFLPAPKNAIPQPPSAPPPSLLKQIAALSEDLDEVQVEAEVDELPKISLKPLIHSEADFTPSSDDFEAKAKEMLASGMDEAIVAVKCNITLSKVFEIRRGQPMHTPAGIVPKATNNNVSSNEMPSPKHVFAARMADFNECLEIAISEYKSDPGSETNHTAMNGFMKTMKDLFESYQDLDDPQETAERLVKQVIYPYMSGMSKLVVEAFRNIMDDVTPSLVSDFQKEQLKDGLKDGLKKITEATRSEFNRAVKTLEVVYEAKLDALYMKPQPIMTSATSVLDTDEPEAAAA